MEEVKEESANGTNGATTTTGEQTMNGRQDGAGRQPCPPCCAPCAAAATEGGDEHRPGPDGSTSDREAVRSHDKKATTEKKKSAWRLTYRHNLTAFHGGLVVGTECGEGLPSSRRGLTVVVVVVVA
jgi:hypothetical protein